MKTTRECMLIRSGFRALLFSLLCIGPAMADEYGVSKVDRETAQQSEVPAAHNDADVSNQDRYSSNPALRDAWLHGKIEAALALNPELNPFTIDTDVDNGVARLAGYVDSYVDKELAEHVARSVDGVIDVENLLEVKTEDKAIEGKLAASSWRQKIDDATVTAKIKTKLLANSDTEGLSINVTTINNEVTLSGAVSTLGEKNLAGLIAKSTSDVTRVDNRIEVANRVDTEER